MARIVLGSYMVRYPLGGMMSWVLQWIVGFQRLGHEIYFVEKAGYPDACYDPSLDVMGDDCSYGTRVVNDLLSRFSLGDRWCFVDYAGTYHGMPREAIESVLATADVFVDMGTHGAWLPEASGASLRVLVDGEPGFTQMKMARAAAAGETLASYDRYYTTGQNIGTDASSAPDADRAWGHVFHPVVVDLFDGLAKRDGARPRSDTLPFTTVMNWQSYEPIEFQGEIYGHKDIEFEHFMELPSHTAAGLEVAVSGQDVPHDRLVRAGWKVRDAHDVTLGFDVFRDYIGASAGEFSVCKSGYVRTKTGWFSDRSAAYLASGRPVVMQETGFGAHLPLGRGLFAVGDVAEAADALDEVIGDYDRHAEAALELARDKLDAKVVLARFLGEIGL
jgi:hypothetical protein